MISWFLIDEYVDLANDRSSLKVDNLITGKALIYYHRHRGIDNQSAITEYDVEKNVCKSVSIYEWPLARIRKLVVRMLSTVKLIKEVSDIALGPSALLLAVEESLDDFIYTGTSFSRKRLINIDIYSYLVDNSKDSRKQSNILDQEDNTLLIKVKIPSSADKDNKKAPTLAEIARTNSKAEIFAIETCEVSRKAVLRQRVLNKDYFCSNTEVIAHFNYYYLTELTSASLIGESLSDDKVFNFNQSPFLQPIGIGCWQDEMNYEESKKFNSPSLQFSAEYITSHGISNGLSYVAFDGHRQILRLDRQGRKSIYDLQEGVSYHKYLFKVLNELTGESEHPKDCIVLQKDNKFSEKGRFMLERLLGIGMANGGTSAYYLGSRVIDHISYEVYEAEMLHDPPFGSEAYNLPILMEGSRFNMPLNKQSGIIGFRFFMTYYLIELSSSHRKNLQSSGSNLVPKFIELWKFSSKNKEKILINRLQFDEFNWALDVEPSSDPDSQDLSKLFDIESCAKDRAPQMQFRFRIIQESKGKVEVGKILDKFKENTQLIKEIIHERLSDILEIPLINIAQVDVSFVRETANLLVESRLVELQSGMSVDKFLGYDKYSDIIQALRDSIINVFENRHSLDACRLDSLSVKERNNMMFCQGLTLCVLFKENATNNYHVFDQVEKKELNYSPNIVDTMCEIHKFTWTLKPAFGYDSKVWSRQNENFYKISRSVFEIPFEYIDDDDDDHHKEVIDFITYKGSGYAPETRLIDPIGFSGFGAALVDLRYTTILEEPNAQNLNYGIEMSLINSREDKFEYCHRACQLDNFCESYSVCIGKKGSSKVNRNDCVLSTLRVNDYIINSISENLKNFDKEESVEIRGTGYYESQVFKFKRDSGCSIYKKDPLFSYKVTKYFNVVADNKTKNEQPQQPNSLIKGQIMSLEECSESTYEISLWLKSTESQFIYCPLSSTCFIYAKYRREITELEFDQLCYGYSKTYLKFFNQYVMTRLAINLRSIINNQNTTSKEVAHTKKIIKPTITDGIKADINEFEELEIGRVIEGLNTEQCARDCNLLESKCLAFDACFISFKHKLCILYSIRSPMSSMKKKFGFLNQEKRFYGEISDNDKRIDTVNVVGDSKCNHYDLKSVYFDIRLHEMLEKDSVSSHDKLGEIENSIIGLDQKESNDIMNTLYDESGENKFDGSTEVEQKDDGGGIHLIALAVGIILGIIGVQYGRESSLYVKDVFSSLRNGIPVNVSRSSRRLSQVKFVNGDSNLPNVTDQ